MHFIAMQASFFRSSKLILGMLYRIVCIIARGRLVCQRSSRYLVTATLFISKRFGM
jgi:hypothetical protein